PGAGDVRSTLSVPLGPTTRPRHTLGACPGGEPPEPWQQLRPRAAEIARDGGGRRASLEQLHDVSLVLDAGTLQLHQDQVLHRDDRQETSYAHGPRERTLVALERGSEEI